ncbi:MAG: ATP-binding protein [Bacteroidia bacterium]|nr:ATP-binding protein [Bacteroidia bacterium]
MRIKTKLTFQFAIITASILFLFSVAIYYFSSNYRKQQFESRLRERALTAMNLLIDVKQIDTNLLDIINKSNIPIREEVIQIWNPDNEKIYSSLLNNSFKVKEAQLNTIRKKGDYYFNVKDKEAVGISYPTLEGDYVAIIAAYDIYGLGKLGYLRIILLTGMLVFFGLALLAGRFYSGQAIKPIENIVSQVEKITYSNLNSRVDEGNGKDEIAELAITFNKMLGRLQSAFDMQRSFVSNASHELRTPLTSITGQIEVTLMSKRDISEYEVTLRSILDDIRSLNKLTNGLLDLALVELDISEIKFRNIRIDELLWQSRIDLIKLHGNYTIDITFEEILLEENSLIVEANEHLLKTAFINLMDNACKYSENKHVNVVLESSSKYVNILFKDSGIGVSEDEIKKIFQPFYRADNSRNISGHGIGIPLTSKIISMHNGEMKFHSVINQGTTVTVSFPSVET